MPALVSARMRIEFDGVRKCQSRGITNAALLKAS